MNIKVSNGADSQGGWTVSIGDEVVGNYQGTKAPLTGGEPGIRRVSVSGNIEGNRVLGGLAISIGGGQVQDVEFNLC